VWFEFGNEEYLAPAPVEQYIQRYKDYRARMKAVDPKVKLGAVLNESANADDGWTGSILRELGTELDFGIIHPYLPKLNKEVATEIQKEMVALSTISADADLEYHLARYQETARRFRSNLDLPLAVTEYNSAFIQTEPIPYRHTLANALHTADFLRVFLKPASHVLFANYWQFANEYWGMVRGFPQRGERLALQGTYYVFSLFNAFLETDLVDTSVQSGTLEYSGGLGVSARAGTARSGDLHTLVQNIPSDWDTRFFFRGTQQQSNGVVTVNFDQQNDTNYFHALKDISVEPNTLYRVRAKVRTIGIKGGKLGIAVEDGRGWRFRFRLESNVFLRGTMPWTWVTVDFHTDADAKKIRVIARRFGGDGPISGRAEFGAVEVEKLNQSFGAVPKITAIATKNESGQLSVILLNKSPVEFAEITVTLPAPYEAKQSEVISGTSPYATNLDTKAAEQITLRPLSVIPLGENRFRLRLPPFSLAGLQFSPRSDR
jgi:hypothetical protein